MHFYEVGLFIRKIDILTYLLCTCDPNEINYQYVSSYFLDFSTYHLIIGRENKNFKEKSSILNKDDKKS